MLVLAAGFGLASFLHRDTERIAELLVSHLHLNPANDHARIFVELASNLSSDRLRTLAGLAALSGAVYVPFELYELYLSVSWLKLAALIVNVVVVAYMAHSIRSSSAAQSGAN